MKATGIVRRIDELGRVVIPKEIRRTLRIRGIAAAGAWDDGGRVRQGHGDSRERAMPQGADR